MPWNAHGEPAAAARHERFRAAAHLARGLVRERDGEDGPRRRALDLGQPRDAVHEHARLAAARAREHEEMARWGGNGFALGRVQRVEQMRNIHAAIVGREASEPPYRRLARVTAADRMSAGAARRSRGGAMDGAGAA